jgi:fructuronate reductase
VTHEHAPGLTTMTVPASLRRSRHPAVPGPGMVHIGLGNFHRAHQAVYTSAAIDDDGGDWGIIGVASRSPVVVDALLEQDLLYTVVTIEPTGSTFSVPRVHTDAFVAADEPERLVAAIAAPSTRIVSLTVTENGYTFSPTTGQLDVDNRDVRHDLLSREAPRSTIGQVVRGLQRRMLDRGDPITVLSCDNLAQNGHRTHGLVADFALRLAGREGTELAEWITANVSFPSSMVDRIVPATAEGHRQLVTSALGYADAIPVPAEPFSMWVMEDDFAAGRPAWEAGGAIFSSEVGAYEQLKLRLLNGTHSLIAYLGALAGRSTIPEAVALEFVEFAARAVLQTEYLPSVTVPAGVDIAQYQEQLFTRWRNTALGHKTSQVGSDGSVKLPQRVCDPAIAQLDAGVMPHYLALTVAAYICCIAPLDGFDPGGDARDMRDAARPRLVGLAARSRSGADLARRIFADGDVFQAELAEREDFVERVGELIDTITTRGARSAAESVRR